MKTINPKDISTADMQGYLQTAIGPRPIAFASTVDKNGKPNLSPFSFFNVFSANPPILVFSPARRVRDNTIKHTLINCQDTKEVVINIVDYDMVHQMSLSSTEYPEGVNEFLKSGFTMEASLEVKPFRVKESPVQFECKINEIISLGHEGGAGNLIICEVLRLHISENILDLQGKIIQEKLDLVSRMGGNWYSRANAGLFEIPNFIKNSPVFNGNDLGMLGNIERLPNSEEIYTFVQNNIDIKGVLSSGDEVNIQQKAKQLLSQTKVEDAWKLLLAPRI